MNILTDFFDYACNECVGGHDVCKNKECWAEIMYSQIVDLKAENAGLKESYEQLNKIHSNGYVYAQKLQNELEELKEENDRLKTEIKYDSRFNDMQAEIDCGEVIIDRCEKAFENIKNCVKSAENLPCMDALCDCENCHDVLSDKGQTCMVKQLKNISKIISEVLDEQ